MIQQFDIKDFKCHDGYNQFLFSGLTIVSGTNNSGKSSLLQAAYLLTQNKQGAFTTLALNDQMRMGSFSDILNKETNLEDTIEFIVYFDQQWIADDEFIELRVQLIYQTQSLFKFRSHQLQPQDQPVLAGMRLAYRLKGSEQRVIHFDLIENGTDPIYEVSGDTHQGYCKLQGIVPEAILYLDAEAMEKSFWSREVDVICKYLRMLDREQIRYLKAYRLDDFQDKSGSRSNDLGLSGEFTAEIIAKRAGETVDFEKQDGTRYTFIQLFDKWTQELLGPDYRVRSELDNGQYRIVVHEPTRGMQFLLHQVGFGISQLLPILTLIFTSKRGDLILIENPEVHLHPKLQAHFVDLCIFAMQHGRKLVLETHSEHIINRIRLNIKRNKELLKHINIYFFEKVEGYVSHTPIEITEEGKLKYWPLNFFDQTYHDLLGLIE